MLKMGIKMPNMGIKDITRKRQLSPAPSRTSLADALFSTTQQRVLAYLFGQPERSFFATELIGLAGGGSGAVQRELARLEDSGLVTVKRIGTQKHFQANPKSPLFAELCGIARKTVGLAEPLREALAPLAKRITAAFVFGSVAKRSDTAASDIDVLVLSDSVDYADVFGALQSAETKLGRTVNPTVYTPANWRRKRNEGNAFVVKVGRQPKVFLIGTEEDLA
ncbi:MAG: nucleotidyltransferase domain-containing protein [Betaproteobacteria bacterium]|nr:nucleotidyltransferase domain-containing protein [Betaproteobacteria bacterium]